LTGSGDAQFCGCRIGDDWDWVNNCRLGLGGVGFWTWFNGVVVCWFSCLTTGSELAKALAATDTVFWAIARALASSVSNPDSESDPDPSPVVLDARPAFWATAILPQLFSRATALVS
jgi:hypothetical protein